MNIDTLNNIRAADFVTEWAGIVPTIDVEKFKANPAHNVKILAAYLWGQHRHTDVVLPASRDWHLDLHPTAFIDAALRLTAGGGSTLFGGSLYYSRCLCEIYDVEAMLGLIARNKGNARIENLSRNTYVVCAFAKEAAKKRSDRAFKHSDDYDTVYTEGADTDLAELARKFASVSTIGGGVRI